MRASLLWPKLTQAFGKQPKIWEEEEKKGSPGVTDRLIDYIIAYADKPSVARRACRLFVGVDGDPEINAPLFSGWNEVRVATLREIREVLDMSGCAIDAHSLADTIKEFLQITWEIFDDTNLNKGPSSIKPEELETYISEISEIIPDSAISYLKYLWGQSRKAPYDVYTDRIICRLGLVQPTDPLSLKRAKLYDLIENKQPIIRHKKLVVLGKRVCITKDPRCGVCPLSSMCQYAKQVSKVTAS